MNYKKINFQNKQGDELAGYLELPLDRNAHNFAIFAHCFTCNKNYFAVKNISSALTSKGFAVLRFDFTGLGESEGDFADTNFSANVEDILAAASYLEKNYKAPTLLVGHSLGGAAVLFASKEITSVTAVATIAAPSSVLHVKHLFKDKFEEIEKTGKASVTIQNRSFNIKKQFLEDLNESNLLQQVSELKKSFLFLHSPQDKIVDIKNAEELYMAAHHPKSFISLDGADHLLSKTRDSLYAGEVIGSWAYRYVDIPTIKELTSKHQVVAFLGKEGYTTRMKAGIHNLTADEPEKAGGENFGPSPYEFVSAGLAACTSMTLQMYARRKEWPLESVETHVDYDKDYAADCLQCENENARIDTFRRSLILKGDLDDVQKKKLLEIAEKCPVHKTLRTTTQVITTLETPEKT